jgi:general secretion pathway protein E
MLIGQMLIAQQAMNENDLQRALAEQSSGPAGQRLGAILVRHGVVSESTLFEALARQLSLPLWRRLEQPEIGLRAAQANDQAYALPEALARRWEAFVSPAGDQVLLLVARDPLLPELLEHAQRRAGTRSIQPMLAAGQDITAALAAIYSRARQPGDLLQSSGTMDLRQLAQDAPIVEFVASMLARGTDLGASDIHIEPSEDGFAVDV